MNKHSYLLLIALLLCSGCSLITTKRIAVTELDYPAELEIISRAHWGWQSLTDTIPTHQVSWITIHHGGVDFPADKDPIEYLVNLQSWSRSDKDWIDIPYHFMIDLHGNIYETRPINFPGDTKTEYDPTGHALICVMGNYENQILNKNQIQAIIDLTVFLAQRFNVQIEDIKGHKDYTETACPGKDLYRYLQDGTIQNGVTEQLKKIKR